MAVTERARARLAALRDDGLSTVHPGGTVITIDSLDVRWFTWAGFRANATLAATLSGLVDEKQSFDDPSVSLRTDLTRDMWRPASRTSESDCACRTSTNVPWPDCSSVMHSRTDSPMRLSRPV